nr:type II secretion system protein [Candidatus Levybacteria bacterium]
MKNNQFGFTLIELVVVMGILLMLFGFMSFNLVGVQRKTSLDSTVENLVSDMATQQTKAMLGVGSSAGDSYGIYFQSDKYTLFKGTTYSASDPTNFIISLDSGITFSNINLPASSLIFSNRTGEISGFLAGQDTITIQDAQGVKTEKITVNRYGVVTGKN